MMIPPTILAFAESTGRLDQPRHGASHSQTAERMRATIACDHAVRVCAGLAGLMPLSYLTLQAHLEGAAKYAPPDLALEIGIALRCLRIGEYPAAARHAGEVAALVIMQDRFEDVDACAQQMAAFRPSPGVRVAPSVEPASIQKLLRYATPERSSAAGSTLLANLLERDPLQSLDLDGYRPRGYQLSLRIEQSAVDALGSRGHPASFVASAIIECAAARL